jgi:hypothetical protein
MREWISLVWLFGIAVAIATVLLHLMFAAAVYVDARRLVDRDKLKAVMVPGEIWALATLLGGVFVAMGYWVIHRSTIAKLEELSPDFDIKDYLS